MVEVDRNGLEVLERGDCLRLLASQSLGRIGVTSGALPCVLPVNFRLVGDQIVFRTGIGTKLESATRNAVVAFEVDHMDPMSHEGWSVVVTGVAREIVGAGDQAELELDRIPRWAPYGNGRVVAVSTEIISGRRLVAGLDPRYEPDAPHP
jgi:nitroimidazol reductase NimA-like FMN-containing flavoprotein (pyridoxamine 5'-phosphate oxidase superfamily)